MKRPDDFNRWYDDHASSRARFCFGLVGNRVEAEDLLQDVFLIALKGRQGFLHKSSVRTWLYRIAYYRSLELRSKMARETEMPVDVSTPFSTHDGRLALEQAIAELPAKHKEAFLLVKVEEFTSREASKILKIPEGTVKYHVFLAVQELRSKLSEMHNLQEETPHAV